MKPWNQLAHHHNMSGGDHACSLCPEPIRPGDSYFHRGKKDRAHVACAGGTIEAPGPKLDDIREWLAKRRSA